VLLRLTWPGNVRELQNFIERSVILSTGAVLSGPLPELAGTSKLSAPVTLEEAEMWHILETLQQTDGVVGDPNGASRPAGPATDDLDLRDAAAEQSRAKLSVASTSSRAGGMS
jgi:DNA-binding NtrC family response regulator